MSLNLVTVVGYHIKSLKHLIEHYKDIVDDINIVVYRNDINDTILDEVTDIIKPYGLEVFDTVVAPIFNWEVVTSLYNKTNYYKEVISGCSDFKRVRKPPKVPKLKIEEPSYVKCWRKGNNVRIRDK